MFSLDVRLRADSWQTDGQAAIFSSTFRLVCLFTPKLIFHQCPPSKTNQTHYGLGGPWIESRWGRDIPHPPRSTPELTQSLIQWVSGHFASSIFSQSRVIQLFQKFFIWPTGNGQFAIVVLWKKKVVRSCDKFSRICKQKNIYIILRLATRRIQNYFCGSDQREVVVTGYAASCLLKGPLELWIVDIATSLLWDAVSCIFTVRCTQPVEYWQCESAEQFGKHTSRNINTS